ncbi:hypothetical protein LXT21_44095 [Myxococcus sp. K38C18041901]|uniref:hypothetical protein n=1 Tax=Myxococcus guangdongensis TaxID=2906760 RepID=UPI0020A7FC12|nr:hypothetical protein [Myxococcus guangdongensis]MCP3065771.1 hypothetical protein [Myxococcus guangdongensis]
MTGMYVLTAAMYPEATSRYAALGSPAQALAALRRDVATGNLSNDDADAIAMGLPLVAMEESARRTGYLRLQEALNADETWAAIEAATGADPLRLGQLQRRLPQMWMRSVWHGTGRQQLAVSLADAPRLQHLELHGYTTDDVRLPGDSRAVHIPVPPAAALVVPDAHGRKWLAAHLLIVEEPAPRRMWRLCLEAGTLDPAPARHVIVMDLPARTRLDTAVQRHHEKAVRGLDWRPIWTWALGAVLTQSPPTSRA